MLHASDPRYQYCSRVGKFVRVCRSETECRGEFGCTKPNCPLEHAFGFEAFDARMKEYATLFDLWPVRATDQPDFP
jgi:hypothetical protein